MGMFDEVRVMNGSHEKFNKNHKGLRFQTKSLENNMSEYCVFNDALFQEVDNSEDFKRHELARPIDFTGEINIYTTTNEDGLKNWIEYDLIFDKGRLVDVAPYEIRVIEDNRDLSKQRPCKPSNRVEVTISVSNCERDKQDAFVKVISDEKLEAIREILEEPTATIFYPVKRTSETRLGFPVYPRISSMASVVQTMEGLNQCRQRLKK